MRTLLLLLVTAALLAPGSALAFRCGQYLVSNGLHKAEVLERCGVPVLRDQYILYPHGSTPSRLPAQLAHRLPVLAVEEWLYDLGPQKFRRLVRFENGYVVDVEVLRKPLR